MSRKGEGAACLQSAKEPSKWIYLLRYPQAVCIGVLFGWLAYKIEGFHWFGWGLFDLPGKPIYFSTRPPMFFFFFFSVILKEHQEEWVSFACGFKGKPRGKPLKKKRRKTAAPARPTRHVPPARDSPPVLRLRRGLRGGLRGARGLLGDGAGGADGGGGGARGGAGERGGGEGSEVLVVVTVWLPIGGWLMFIFLCFMFVA